MKIKTFGFFLLMITFPVFSQQLSSEQATHLASLPLKCIDKQYPNKLNQVLLDSTEIKSPVELHPAFYGCFDWHSSVHGHWSLIYLLKNFPGISDREKLFMKLDQSLTKEAIKQEINYFSKEHEKSFERMYGWAWLLKLQMEIDTYDDPHAIIWAGNLKPLTDVIVLKYLDFLPKLTYPVRVGTHTNTAFGLSFAWDYAKHINHEELLNLIRKRAIYWFGGDKNCPLEWEPGGTDFFSPCMEEIGLMQRILDKDVFWEWLQEFVPMMVQPDFVWETAKVSDRTDGHLVHLDGLNFSRAWNLYALYQQYPDQLYHLKKIADEHLIFSLPSIIDGNYEGEHWLASFALRVFEIKAKNTL